VIRVTRLKHIHYLVKHFYAPGFYLLIIPYEIKNPASPPEKGGFFCFIVRPFLIWFMNKDKIPLAGALCLAP
jgi:hypothetical protein